jgi:hypothetical protein
LLDRVYCATTLARNGPVTEWVDSFDSRFDELWRQVDTTRLVIGQRTSKFLTWRFPRSGKRTLVFVARQSGGAAIHTYFVGEVESSVFVVKDFLTIASGTRLDKTMHAFIRATRQLGVSAISISMLPTPTVKDAFVRARFVARDSRSCFFTLSQGSPEALATASWHLTAADEDM